MAQAPLIPGDVVTGPCQPVGNLPPRQLALDGDGRLAEVPGSGVTARGMLFLASRKQQYKDAFAARGLAVCDDDAHRFARAENCLRLNLGPAGFAIVVAGYAIDGDGNQQPAVIRYKPDGSRDATFGDGGLALPTFGPGSTGSWFALAVQADGKYVAAGPAGITATGGLGFAVGRFNTDGTLDPGFGEAGLATSSGSGGDIAYAVAVGRDGKIVAAGQSGPAWALVRYDADGSLDTGFGTGGMVTTDFVGSPFANSTANAVLIQGDGKIVAVGVSGDADGANSFALARYDTAGALDPSFGTGGKVTTGFEASPGDIALAAILQGDGKIVAVGITDAGPEGGNAFALVRYNADGSLDAGFGTGGVVITDLGVGGGSAWAAALQADGKIVAAGALDATFWFAVAGYNTDGSLDSGFGTAGLVTTDVGLGQGRAVAVQGDGKVVVAGFANSFADVGLARYDTAGALDPSFGTGGLVDDDVGGFGGSALAVVLAPLNS